jgi:hypothetical protein
MAQVATDAQRIMGQVTAMAMLDDEFRARLEAAPLEVLREFGMELSGAPQVELVSDPADLHAADESEIIQLYVPEATDLSEEELSMVAGAVASCETTASSCCCITCLSSASSWSSNSC